MRLYNFLLIVEDFSDEHEEEFLCDKILLIEDLHEVTMAMEIYVQYFPVDTFSTDR